MKRKTRQAEGDQVPPQKQIVQSKGSSGGSGKSGGGSKSGNTKSGSSAANNRTSASAGGAVPETRFPSCKECGDELCSGGCKVS